MKLKTVISIWLVCAIGFMLICFYELILLIVQGVHILQPLGREKGLLFAIPFVIIFGVGTFLLCRFNESEKGNYETRE